MRNRRYTHLILAATFAFGGLTALGSGTPASAAPAGAAAELFNMVNAERATAGLAPLAWRDDVSAIAVDWSTVMSDVGQLMHNDAYFSDGVRRQIGSLSRGENVAVAGTIARAHSTLMNSPAHLAAILDPGFTEAGFGAVQDAGGQWWVTQNFLRSHGAPAPAPAPEPIPEEPAPAPVVQAVAAPVATAPPTTAAPLPAPTTPPAVAPTTVALPESPAVEWSTPAIAAASSSGVSPERTAPEASDGPAVGLMVIAAAVLAMTASGHIVHHRRRA